MYQGLFYTILDAMQIQQLAEQGRISLQLLFGTSGDDGLMVEHNPAHLRSSIDGSFIIMKFYPYALNRSVDQEYPLDYLIRRAQEEGIYYELHSHDPVRLSDGYYAPCQYELKELPLILEEIEGHRWVTPTDSEV